MIVVSYSVGTASSGARGRSCSTQPLQLRHHRPRSKLVLLMSDEVLRALPRDERVMTESIR